MRRLFPFARRSPAHCVRRTALPPGCLLLVSLLIPCRLLSQTSPSVTGSGCRTREGDVPGLGATVNVGGIVTAATTNALTTTADMKLTNWDSPPACETRRQRSLLLASGKYDQKGKHDAAQTITRVYTLMAQHLVFLPGDQTYMSGQADLLSNSQLGVYLQQAYGARLGRFFDLGRLTFDLAAGPALVGQHFLASDTSTRFVAASTAGGLALAFGPRNDKGELQPGPVLSLQYHGLYRLGTGGPTYNDAELLFVVPMLSRVSFTATVFGDYLSNAPTGFKNTFLTTTVGLQFKLVPL